jgi:hypothetical protein
MTEMDEPRRHRPEGPNAGILGIVSLALTIASVVVPPLFAAGTFFPSPQGSTDAVNAYLVDHRGAVTATGFLVFAASVPLGIYAATTYARLLRLGVRVPGPNIAFFGGIAASVLLSISGLLTWAIGQPVTGQSPAMLHTLDYVVYALGGVGFVGALGLLIAGIAVPTLIIGLAPRWLAWAGLVLAALSELSFFALVLPPLAFLLPIGRFLGLAWLLAIGFLLPRNRHDVTGRAAK